jgi:unsaturated rhamnogalacturonyl hydrolase
MNMKQLLIVNQLRRSPTMVGLLTILFAALLLGADAAPTTAPAKASGMASPKYPVPYGEPTTRQIASTLRTIGQFIDEDSGPGAEANGANERTAHFNLISYPMGVLYAGELAAAEATGEQAHADYVAQRFQYMADQLAAGSTKGGLRNLIKPTSLDACGAMGAAIVKARRAGVGPDLKGVIDTFADYISHKQFRLPDGTLARNSPFPNSVWGDDAYMSVPFLAQMGALTGNRSYFDDAAKQIIQMYGKLFVPSVGLCTHAWNAENPDDHPHYYWGRANGWCIVATVELLSVLPDDHPAKAQLLQILRAHAQGIATAQSGAGLWHQMLDRPDSYLETSCSAMFTYALARGINRGWLDAAAYGPVAQAGWNGLTTRISNQGHITGTCIGTNYADDYVYYYNRPAVDDVHGYGPVLLAGSEMIHLLENKNFRIESPGGRPTLYIPKKTEN